jgi:hypothetical protein
LRVVDVEPVRLVVVAEEQLAERVVGLESERLVAVANV